MASVVRGLIEQIQIDNSAKQNIASTAYGICETPASTAQKVVEMSGFVLITGVTIHVKFLYGNSALSPTLNVNNTGEKSIVIYGNTTVGTNGYTTGWNGGAVVTLTYDGTNWVRDASFNELNVPNVIAKTTNEWLGNASYVPPKDTIMIYTDHGTITVNDQTYNVPGIKVADGLAYGVDQPFVGDDVKEQILTILNAHISDNVRHITNEERIFWNNKLNCQVAGETLQLNRL